MNKNKRLPKKYKASEIQREKKMTSLLESLVSRLSQHEAKCLAILLRHII